MQQKILIRDATHQQWLSFSEPEHVFELHSLSDVRHVLEQIENKVRTENLWAAGWLSYEAASAFDPALKTYPPTRFPVLWFGLFKHCEPVNLEKQITQEQVKLFQQTVWSLNSKPDDYANVIDRIKYEIKNGNTYQVNYTIRQYADLDLPAEDAFFGFAANARYGAFLDTGQYALCCASPELFFEINDGEICARPMKGTAPRGRYLEQDITLRDELYMSEKNRAENLMIVDMIRNDIGRIADTGSVAVPKLFEIEKYPTLWQMTSTVTAKLDTSLVNIFNALFPCASITGAPKANTMKIINQLESSPRNIYTGTIGFIRPDMSMQFNVAIRTALIDKQFNQAEYGVGGGIVWDSQADSEYEECLTKSKVLSGQGMYTHQLLETLLWTPGQGFYLLDYHLNRLTDSAEYFDYQLDVEQVKARLNESIALAKTDHRVRLLIKPDGLIEIQISEHNVTPTAKYRLKFADQSVDETDIFLFHKTTQRDVYDYFLKKNSEFDDVLLFNSRQQITESCIANLVIEVEGNYFTPQRECGLLNGTYRQYLLDTKKISEGIIDKQMLLDTKNIYLINSVRKWWPVELVL